MAGFFDETYYLQHKVDQLAKAGTKDPDGRPYNVLTLKIALSDQGMSPEDHYKMYGRSENLNPNPYFNEVEYLAAKKAQLAENDPSWATKSVDELRDAMAKRGVTPAEHYEKYGAFEANSKGELLNPSNAFDANAYFAAKLVELQVAGVSGADTLTVTQVVKIFQEAGMSPVTHYGNYGAHEAEGTKTPLVQTVPSEQRVPNDPARTENVPGNYNPPTVGAVSPEAAPAPVAKPADVGAKVSSSVSPAVTPPAKPLPVPGDDAYVPPPSNLVDTNDKPVVPPSGATNGDWAQVNPDGSADLIKPDGTPGGSLPPNSLNPADPSSPAPNPNPGGGTGGGGGGGEAEGESAAELAARVVATFDSETNTLNIDLADSEQFNGSVKVHVDAQDKVTAKVINIAGSEANILLPETPDITTINIKARVNVEADLSKSPSVKTFYGSIHNNSKVYIDSFAGYTFENVNMCLSNTEGTLTLTDADFAQLASSSNLALTAVGDANITLGENAGQIRELHAGNGETTLSLEAKKGPGSFLYSAKEGGTHHFTNKTPADCKVELAPDKDIAGTFTGLGSSKKIQFGIASPTNTSDTLVDLSNVILTGFSEIFLSDAVCLSPGFVDVKFGMATLSAPVTIDSNRFCRQVDASAATVDLTIKGDSYKDIDYTLTGGSGEDFITTIRGTATLTGGAGNDTFGIGCTLSKAQVITDFTPGSDTLGLNSNLFAGETTVTPTQFRSGAGATTAQTSAQRFIYDTSTGKLYFDADGNGADFSAVHFATLSNKPQDLSVSDISFVNDSDDRLYEWISGSQGNDRLIVSKHNFIVAGNGGNDTFLLNLSDVLAPGDYDSGVTLTEFSVGDKIGILDGTPITMAANKADFQYDGNTYSITNGVLRSSTNPEFAGANIEKIMNAAGTLAKGQTVVVQGGDNGYMTSIKLFISDGEMTSTTSSDYTVSLGGVNLPSLVTEVILDNGFITGFTGA